MELADAAPPSTRRPSRPALVLAAKERERALREVRQLIEGMFQDEPDTPRDEAGRTAAAVNGALRRLYADVLALSTEGPPKKTRHKWEYDVSAGLFRCARCPVTRERKATPEGIRYVYARAGEVLRIGPPAHVGAPPCERAPNSLPERPESCP